jgi:hypothetical protein
MALLKSGVAHIHCSSHPDSATRLTTRTTCNVDHAYTIEPESLERI